MRLTMILAALLTATPAFAAATLPAPLIDNARVTVWGLDLAKGETRPATLHDRDTVIMFLEGGTIRTVANGKTTTATRKFGDAVFVPRGSDATDTLLSDGEKNGTAHEIVIALKDGAPPAVPNTSGLPDGFPRPGAVKVLDNARVTVWNYSWHAGEPTPMHFHGKEVVVAYRYDNGSIRSTTQDGKSVITPHTAGDVSFNLNNRIHSEELTGPRQSAVMVEFK